MTLMETGCWLEASVRGPQRPVFHYLFPGFPRDLGKDLRIRRNNL